MSCGFEVKLEAFEKFCIDYTMTNINGIYYMPQRIHKIPIHGGSTRKAAELPLGHLSEEAQEARNKDTRIFRELHS